MKKKLRPCYSGNLSREFWERVNALPQPDQQVLYACGCLLQNLEGSVLQWLENAELRAREEK